VINEKPAANATDPEASPAIPGTIAEATLYLGILSNFEYSLSFYPAFIGNNAFNAFYLDSSLCLPKVLAWN